jgi:hypothetical protein
VPTASPTPTITPATGPYPLGTRTGIASVDRVLDAIDSGDLAQVQATFHYWPAPCKTFPPPGLLRCEAGEPNGTPIDGIGAEGTEGAHYRPSEVLSLSIGADLVDPSLIDPRLYAVVEIHNPTEPWYRYKIVFENGQAVVADDIGLTFFPCGCQRAPAEQVAWGIPKSPIGYVLRPR